MTNKAGQQRPTNRNDTAIAAVSLVAAVVILGVLFGVHSCKAEAEAERERQIQEALSKARAEFQESVNYKLSQLEERLRKGTPRPTATALNQQFKDYSFGTAEEMMRELLDRNPQIAQFLSANPDKQRALEEFLSSKASAGDAFNLKWDDGDHRFR